MNSDVKDFYLNMPMARYGYMRLLLSDISEEIIEEYNLREKMTPDRYVYIEVSKGMYSLPQAGIIAQELLQELLGKHGYRQSKIVPGYWKHDTKPISFILEVDGFMVKYTREEDANQLVKALKKYYNITIDKEATKYIGLTLEGDYENGQVHVHMPGYLDKSFTRFKHERPPKNQNSPHPHIVPKYGAKAQYVEIK